MQFGLLDHVDYQQLEVIVREQADFPVGSSKTTDANLDRGAQDSKTKQTTFREAESLVDHFAFEQKGHGWVWRLAVDLPSDANRIPLELASEWATPLAMRNATTALTGSQRRIGELAENLKKAQQRGVDLEEELTNLRALNETLELLAMVASKTDNAVIILDNHFRVEWVNDSFVRMTGYDMGEVHLTPIIDLLHGEASENVSAAELQSAFSAGHGVTQEILQQRKDGRTYWASISITPVFNEEGAITRWIGIAIDATRRRKAQEVLNQAKEEAEMASRAKSEFLANMSHEIRTPMNTVIGMTELALGTNLDNEQREYMSTILDSAESLLRLLNDILDLSKIEAQKLQLEHKVFSLEKTLHEALKPFSFQAKVQGITLSLDVSVEAPETLIGDPGRLRQVVTNLIGNAVKFTAEGEICLSVELTKKTKRKATLKFSVRDTGIGIASDKLREIFEAFTQEDSSTSRRFGGTGLGLAISAQLAEMMHGRIWVESQQSVGSTFHFEAEFGLPADVGCGRAPIPIDSNKPAEESKNTRQLRILVADDNRSNRSLARKVLEKWNHFVVEASSGQQVLDLVVDNSFDVILLDVQMPEMDGLETATAVRKLECQLPLKPFIIALTARAMQGDRERCLNAGMDAYIAKPLRAIELMSIINEVACVNHPLLQETNEAESSDFSAALARLEGDRDLLAEQMRFFLEDSPILISDICDAIDQGNFQKLQMSAHRLRGLSAGFDAQKLVDAAGELEQRATAGGSNLAKTEEVLVQEYDSLCHALQNYLSR